MVETACLHFKHAGNAILLGFGGVTPKSALQQPTCISFCNNLHFPFAKNSVREILQNAIDACNEKSLYSTENYNPVIHVDYKDNQLIVVDNGIGMSENVIKNYFLVAGASYKDDIEWKKSFTLNGQNIFTRGGKFGIGVLSYFLLCDEIDVETSFFNSNIKYNFRAKLDTDQIDVYKTNTNCNSGTKIGLLFISIVKLLIKMILLYYHIHTIL